MQHLPKNKLRYLYIATVLFLGACGGSNDSNEQSQSLSAESNNPSVVDLNQSQTAEHTTEQENISNTDDNDESNDQASNLDNEQVSVQPSEQNENLTNTAQNESQIAIVDSQSDALNNFPIPLAQDSQLSAAAFLEIFSVDANWYLDQRITATLDAFEEIEGRTGPTSQFRFLVSSKADETQSATISVCGDDKEVSPLIGDTSVSGYTNFDLNHYLTESNNSLTQITCPQPEMSLAFDGRTAERRITCANGNDFVARFTMTNKSPGQGTIIIDPTSERTRVEYTNACVQEQVIRIEEEGAEPNLITNSTATLLSIKQPANPATDEDLVLVTLTNTSSDNNLNAANWEVPLLMSSIIADPEREISVDYRPEGQLNASFEGLFFDGIRPNVTVIYDITP